MTGQRLPIPTRFPWEQLCVGTGLKTDHARQPERIKIAEETLVARSLELKDNAEHEAEFQAIEDALRNLAVLKRKRLTASRTKYVAASCVYCNSLLVKPPATPYGNHRSIRMRAHPLALRSLSLLRKRVRG